MKRNVLGTALAAAGFVLAMSVGARAENFPARPVTLIVPWPAGGSTDVGMRALAGAAEKHLGQSIVVENRPGGSGTLGPGQMAATAKPDGYTIAQIPITVFRFPFMTKTSFDPATDFTYIIGVSGYTFGVVVRDDASWKTFRDLIADARANPTRINYGTPGAGTSLHITMEQIAKQQGIVDARPVQGQCRFHERAAGWPHSRRRGFERMGTTGQCRPLPSAGDLGRRAHKELARCADLARNWDRHDLELAVRHRRPQGHGPQGRRGSA
jgi:tripartite-type tricarboxylate transporter receptor subunit TctC